MTGWYMILDMWPYKRTRHVTVVCLIGDAPSVDPATGKKPPASSFNFQTPIALISASYQRGSRDNTK